jgi:AcrR family transcriptional regulator
MPTVSTGGRLYGGKTAEQRRAERRERLLDAGLEHFGGQGFAATTIEAICATARLNPRYFYEQFETREELLAAVYDRHVESVLALVLAAITDAPTDPRVRMELGLRAFITGTLRDERAARINYFEMVGVSPTLEGRRRSVLRAYAELIAAQMAELDPEGVLFAGDRRLLATALVGATDGLITEWLSGEGGDPGAATDPIVATLLAIFVQPRPGGVGRSGAP